MANGDADITEGAGFKFATYNFTEDAVTRNVGRSTLNNSSGTEIGTSSTPIEVNVRSSTVTIPVSYATTGSGNATGALRVELPTNGTGVIATVGAVTAITNALPAGTNNIGDVDVLTLPVAFNSGVTSATTQRMVLATDVALPAGNNNIGDVDILSIAAGDNNIGNVDIESQKTFTPSADVTMQNAAVATGNGTNLTVTGYGVAVIQVTGTFVGTVTFEGTTDGTNWVSISATQIGAGTILSTATTTGIFRLAVSGITTIRARISAYTSGSITAIGRASNATLSGKVVTLSTSVTGGYTPGKLISAATTNATSVKTSGGTIGYLTASNVNAAARFLKIYNKASSPTVGTDVPVHTFLIPGNTAGAGTNIPLPPQGMALGTGIAFAITAAVADSDTTAVAANEIMVNYGFI